MALNFPGIMQGPVALIAAPQAFTAAWVDLGDEQFVQGARFMVLWGEFTVNDSTNMRVRVLAKLEEGGAVEYTLPIETDAAAVITVEPRLVELANDADQDMVFGWELAGAAPWVQFQIQVGAVGADAGTIDSALVTTVF